jgi:hypothetical protein
VPRGGTGKQCGASIGALSSHTSDLGLCRDSLDGCADDGLVVRFVVQGSVDGEALDKCVEDACRGWVEELLERSSAAGHPGVGDIAIAGFAGGEGIELVGEDKVALVAEDGVCVMASAIAFLAVSASGSGESFLNC